MANSIRDKIRSATIGKTKKFKNEMFDLGDGIEVEFRQPSLKAKSILMEKATKGIGSDGKMQIDMIDFLIWSVITCTYVPNTNDLVYEEEDYNEFKNMPTGSFVEEFGNKVSELMNVEEDVKK